MMTRMGKALALLFYLIVFGMTALLTYGALSTLFATGREQAVMNQQLDALEQRIEHLQQVYETNKEQEKMIEELRQENRKLYRRVLEMEEWIEGWEVEDWEASFYAPLDPAAVEGMCYSGDPTVTKSGATVEIGRTVAAGPDIPIGTLLYIEGFGWREVQDRGSAVNYNDDGLRQVDIAVATRQEALALGRQEVIVVYQGVE